MIDQYIEEVDELIEAFGLGDLPDSDPARIAIEAAVSVNIPITIAASTAKFLPPKSTQFEHGLAYGIALMLAARRRGEL